MQSSWPGLPCRYMCKSASEMPGKGVSPCRLSQPSPAWVWMICETLKLLRVSKTGWAPQNLDCITLWLDDGVNGDIDLEPW